jgi:hypothetical protein
MHPVQIFLVFKILIKKIGFYSTLSYYLATLSVEFPVLLGIVIVYGCVSYWMVGLEHELISFLYFLLIIFLVINVGFSMAQVISAGIQERQNSDLNSLLNSCYNVHNGNRNLHGGTSLLTIAWRIYCFEKRLNFVDILQIFCRSSRRSEMGSPDILFLVRF